MANAADYIADVQKHAPEATEDEVAKIVKHLGIALRSRDASLVSCSDPSELARVRESWLKKKLALTDADADLDAAISGICTTLAGDNTKERVTFYYLLAKHYGKIASL